MASIGLELVILALLILINGLFALSEMAIVSARKTRLQQRAIRTNFWLPSRSASRWSASLPVHLAARPWPKRWPTS